MRYLKMHFKLEKKVFFRVISLCFKIILSKQKMIGRYIVSFGFKINIINYVKHVIINKV